MPSAEILMVHFIIENNLPVVVDDKCCFLFKSRPMFPDSNEAKHTRAQTQCAKTKTFGLLNGDLVPNIRSELVTRMQNGPSAFALDGSNGSDFTKMNSVTVQMYDARRNIVTSHVLDMYTTTVSTAATISEKIDKVMEENNILWSKLRCVFCSQCLS